MKDFSYMFYPGDVLRDTQFFTDAQKGCYLSILCCHIENIRISYDLIMIITRSLSDYEKTSFLKIFDKDEEGYFINWAVNAIEKRSDYLKSRSNNKSGRKKNDEIIEEKKEIIQESYDLHMVNENVKEEEKEIKLEIKNKNKKLNVKKPIDHSNELDTIFMVFNEYFKTNYENNFTINTNYNHWRQFYEPEQIEQSIINASKDQFWKDKLTPVILFRQKNQNKEDVDYIGSLLNRKPEMTPKQEMGEAFKKSLEHQLNKIRNGQ